MIDKILSIKRLLWGMTGWVIVVIIMWSRSMMTGYGYLKIKDLKV